MFHTLKPGCKGVLMVEEVNNFSLKQFKAAETFISESLGIAEDMDDSISVHDDGHMWRTIFMSGIIIINNFMNYNYRVTLSFSLSKHTEL